MTSVPPADGPAAYLCFVSEAVAPQSLAALEGLAERASARNQALGITGLLLYGSGHFMHLMEGPPLEMLDLYDRIASDPRHTDVRKLALGETPRRLFPDWYVGALELEARRPLDRARLLSIVERSVPAPVRPDDVRYAVALMQAFVRLLPGPPRD